MARGACIAFLGIVLFEELLFCSYDNVICFYLLWCGKAILTNAMNKSRTLVL